MSNPVYVSPTTPTAVLLGALRNMNLPRPLMREVERYAKRIVEDGPVPPDLTDYEPGVYIFGNEVGNVRTLTEARPIRVPEHYIVGEPGYIYSYWVKDDSVIMEGDENLSAGSMPEGTSIYWYIFALSKETESFDAIDWEDVVSSDYTIFYAGNPAEHPSNSAN